MVAVFEMKPAARWLAPALLLLSIAGCRKQAAQGTGLFVTVSFDGALGIDQVELAVSAPAADGGVVPPTLRPASAAGPLGSPQTVVILLPDALAGAAVTCTVTGVARGVRLDGAGVGTADIQQGVLVPVMVALGGAAPDGGGTGKANGTRCSSGAECDSTLCVDGVCCASACGGVCQSCNVAGSAGNCTPVPAGTASPLCAQQPPATCGFDGTCDGSGGCRRYPAGVACAQASCTAGQLKVAAACDGQGTCTAGTPVDCTPYACDTAAPSPRCRVDCVVAADCTANSCVGGSCGPAPKKANGAGCLAAPDCLSGICQDGVCCATDCKGACTTCALPSDLGTCQPVAMGKPDPHGVCTDMGVSTCGTNGLCDGAGACTKYPAGTACSSASCHANLIRSRKCDGQGTCAAATDVDCDPYKCDPTTTACFTGCTADKQCDMVAGRTCASGTCQ
jgi:hypothetical protein